MNPDPRPAVLVIGAGAFGLACALAAQARGLSVALIHDRPLDASASAVAAGMLAPASEAIGEGADAPRFSLYRQGRDLWPALLERIGAPAPDRSGAVFAAPGDPEALARWTARAAAIGVKARPCDPRERVPGLADEVREGLFLADDWRLDAEDSLTAMLRAFERAGGRRIEARVTALEGVSVALADGARIEAGAVVLAGGQTTLSPVPLTPVHGQLVRFEAAGPRDGAVLRTPAGYLAPSRRGVLFGATMRAGETEPDAAVEADQRAAARALIPALETARAVTRSGVRAATPDGLPAVGRQTPDGPVLALGARRNGWLLAPLVGELVAHALSGEATPPELETARAALDASRFSPG